MNIDSILARFSASRLDAQLAAGADPASGRLLAARAAQLVAARERRALARNWAAVPTRQPGSGIVDPRVAVDAPAVVASNDLVRDLVARLQGPQRVSVRGVASARQLLTDGMGPLFGRSGDLRVALRGVLAALG